MQSNAQNQQRLCRNPLCKHLQKFLRKQQKMRLTIAHLVAQKLVEARAYN